MADKSATIVNGGTDIGGAYCRDATNRSEFSSQYFASGNDYSVMGLATDLFDPKRVAMGLYAHPWGETRAVLFLYRQMGNLNLK